MAEREATAKRALEIARVTEIDDATVEYFERVGAAGLVGYKFAIRDGAPMTSEQKKAYGLKTRAIIGSRFFSYLNEEGRRDPQEAAHLILAIMGRQRECISDLKRGPDYLDGDTQLRFFPSNMAAGPCPRAATLSRQLMNPSSAPLLPLADCEHPSQCGCKYLPKHITWK